MKRNVPVEYLTSEEAAFFVRMRKSDFVTVSISEKLRFIPSGRGKLFHIEDLRRWMERRKIVEQKGRN
jgi:hypothetical protein